MVVFISFALDVITFPSEENGATTGKLQQRSSFLPKVFCLFCYSTALVANCSITCWLLSSQTERIYFN